MSDFLNVCGLVLTCKADKFAKTHEPIGGHDSRAADATLRINYQALKWKLKGTTIPLTYDVALFAQAILDGDGDHLPYDVDTTTDKGNAPSATAGAPAISAVQSKYGGNALLIHNTVGELVTYTFAPFGEGFTFLIWRYESAAWHWYLVTQLLSGGVVQVYRDGVFFTSGIVPAWMVITFATGVLTLQRIAADGTAVYYDDVVMLNAFCPSSLVAALYAFHNAQAWPTPFPMLNCAGDFHPVALTMGGKPGDSELIPGVLAGGAFTWNNVQLAFEIMES
jgi:hypothetical protein